MSVYNLKSCSDLETLNATYQTLCNPFHEAFNQEIDPIEKEYAEACKEPLALFDAEVKEVYDAVNQAYQKIEAEHKQKMEDIRREALRRIRIVESKLKKQQEKLQAAYFETPLVIEAQKKLKEATAEFDAKRDEAIKPHTEKLKTAIEPLQTEYQEALKQFEGASKIRRFDR